MTTADEVALCESIVEQFETVGLGTDLDTNDLHPPFQSSLTRILKRKVFSPGGSGSSGYSDIYTDVYTDNLGSGTGAWVDMPRRSLQLRPMPEPFTGQNPPYDPTWVKRWVPIKRHACHTKVVRTIESFVAPGALYGDGVPGGGQQQPSGHDDTVQMNNAISAALRFAHNNGNTDLVVSFTRTYICNNTLTLSPDRIAVGVPVPNGLQNPHATSSIEFTGPGGITRHYKDSSGNFVVTNHGADRINASVKVYTDRTKFTSCRIDSNRPHSADGGRNNDFEAQHAFWFIATTDCELRNVFCSNFMGDCIAVAGVSGTNPRGTVGLRVYNCRFVNNGRHCITPLGVHLDFYGNTFERNSSHLCDLETSGTGEMYNHMYRNNRFTGCRGSGMRMPAFAGVGTKQCNAHGTFLRGCAWIENVRDYVTYNATNQNSGAFDMILSSLDLGWTEPASPQSRTVTQCTTAIGSNTVSSPNFALNAPTATWTGELRAALSGPGIPTNSYIDEILSPTSLRIVTPGGTGATANSSTATLSITCIAGPYGVPTNVGPDHASCGEHESTDLRVIRNMWSRNGPSAAMWRIGGDTPPGYQGFNHEGGAAGYNRIQFQYNYGPCVNSVTGDSAFLNCTNIIDGHITSSVVPLIP